MTDPARDPFIDEIMAQPATLRRAGVAIGGRVAALAAVERVADAARRAGRPPLVLLTGMGGSLEACRAVLPALARAGVAAFEVETAELVHARRGLLAHADAVVLVTQSARSAEALRLAELLGASGGPPLVAVTNTTPNPLSDRSAIVVETRAGPEKAPSTGTFTASIVALDAVAAVLAGAPGPAAARAAVAAGEAAARAVEVEIAGHEERALEWRRWLGDRRDLFVLGRGVGAATAGMGALLAKEATAIHAEAMSGATFRHGPLEQAGPGTAVAIVALEPDTAALDAALAADLAATGSPVAWVGPGGTAPAGRFGGDVPGVTGATEDGGVAALPGAIAAVPAVIPFQLLAWQLACERGSPGTFRRAGKVTTRE